MHSAQSLFGRERELGELRRALLGAEAGRGALVLLVGEPGIGKTRLATAFTDEAAARGARVSWGRAWESGARRLTGLGSRCCARSRRTRN